MTNKAEELKMHEKDTGSSEVQIALLTGKLKLFQHILSNSKKINIHLLDC